MELLTILKLVTAILGILLFLFGILNAIGNITDPPSFVMSFYQMYSILSIHLFRFFGMLMFLSLFDLKVVKENFYLVKSTKGKGIFSLFICTTFLAMKHTQWVYAISYGAVGVGYLFVGFMKPDLDEVADISKADMTKAAFDNRHLLAKAQV